MHTQVLSKLDASAILGSTLNDCVNINNLRHVRDPAVHGPILLMHFKSLRKHGTTDSFQHVLVRIASKQCSLNINNIFPSLNGQTVQMFTELWLFNKSCFLLHTVKVHFDNSTLCIFGNSSLIQSIKPLFLRFRGFSKYIFQLQRVKQYYVEAELRTVKILFKRSNCILWSCSTVDYQYYLPNYKGSYCTKRVPST